MTDTLPQYIGGERIGADAPEQSLNPSNTNDVGARVPRGGEAEVNERDGWITVEVARIADHEVVVVE